MPAMPSHIVRIAQENGVVLPKGTADSRKLMAFAAAAYKDSKKARRALKQSVEFYNKARNAYGPKKTKSNRRKKPN